MAAHNYKPYCALLQSVVSRGGQRFGLRGADAAAGAPPLLRDRAVRHHDAGRRGIDPPRRGTSVQYSSQHGEKHSRMPHT